MSHRQGRSVAKSTDNGADALLQHLLESSPPSADDATLLSPVLLRSRKEHRRQTFPYLRLRTWVDDLLHHTERLLLIVTVGFFVFWLLNGYGRDWLHSWQQDAAAQQLPAAPASPIEPDEPSRSELVADTLVALPFTDNLTTTIGARPAPPDYLAPAALPLPNQPADARPQRLVIPVLQIDTPVQEVFIENGAWQVADYAAGYHHGTALPGDGNTVMAGHAGLRGAVFRDLGALQPGQEITVDAGGWRFIYHVRERRQVWPTQVEVMAPTATAQLTLITCTAWDTQRIVIIADLVDTVPL